jgi:nucleotide-binding universal stress UspA family protein
MSVDGIADDLAARPDNFPPLTQKRGFHHFGRNGPGSNQPELADAARRLQADDRRIAMPRFQKIVVAVDFSQTSEDALEAACELAQTHHGHVHLLHVVPDPVLLAYTTEPVSLDVDAMLRQWTDGAREQLTALAARQQPKPQSLTTAVVAGSAAPEIVKYALEQHADLIVLGSHGRGFVDRLLLGNVAERVLRLAHCPVIVVPHRTRRPTSFEVNAAAGVGS